MQWSFFKKWEWVISGCLFNRNKNMQTRYPIASALQTARILPMETVWCLAFREAKILFQQIGDVAGLPEHR